MGILEVGLRTPLRGRKIHKFALGAEMASYGPAYMVLSAQFSFLRKINFCMMVTVNTNPWQRESVLMSVDSSFLDIRFNLRRPYKEHSDLCLHQENHR
jgi:hypothetical protein